MSFDVVLHSYRDGDVDGRNEAVRAALAPYLVRHRGEIWNLQVGESTAEVYGLDGPDGFLATHIGHKTWDLLVEAARVGRFIILPQSGPACVAHPDHVQDVPPHLRAGVVVVADGAQLHQAIDDFGIF